MNGKNVKINVLRNVVCEGRKYEGGKVYTVKEGRARLLLAWGHGEEIPEGTVDMDEQTGQPAQTGHF